MNFYIDPAFYVFLALAVIPAAILGFTGHRIRYYGLAASLGFLLLLFGENAQGMAAFLGFLAVACAATFWVLRSWRCGQKALWKYRVALAAVIAPLAIYKIGAVFEHNIMGFLGLSYITFKAVQVIIEVRDGVIEDMGFLDYLYFLVFFAPFTSGPIDRSRRFTEDANRTYTHSEYADLLARGIMLLLIGAVYQKVLGTVFYGWFTPAPLGDGSLWRELAAQVKDAYMYGLYLFFDFAGYSLMAMGASYCFGIKTPRNFRAPFFGFGRARVLGSLAHHPLDVAARFRVHARGEVGHAAQAVQRAPAYCLFRLSRELHAHGCLARADGRLFGVRRILRRTHGGDGRVPEEVAVS